MGKPVIICVDDEPTVLESLKIELKRVLNGQCLVETAEGGLEALELIQELHQGNYEVALVLADYIMPDIRGDELLRQIHKLSSYTLNIMISGQADLEAVGNAIRHARLYRYIAKPWQVEDLRGTVLEAIQSYLRDRKLEAQNIKLQQSEAKLYDVLNSAIAAICSYRVFSDFTWDYAYCSAGCAAIYGYNAEQLMGDRTLWLSHMLPEDREVLVPQIFQHIVAECPIVVEYRFILPDGRLRWIAETFTSRRDDTADCWIATSVSIDISDRKHAEEALQRQLDREHALNQVVQAIRHSLDLDTIFATTVREVGRLLQIDRVQIVHYLPEQSLWRVESEFCKEATLSTTVGLEISEQNNSLAARLKQCEVIQIDDVSTLEDEINQTLAQTLPGSWLLISIDLDMVTYRTLWGGLTLIRHAPTHRWQPWEVDLANAVADQLAIAIQQSDLYRQVQKLNDELEDQVQERTQQLQQALEFEALLKRITDRVRDSLDEHQILQTVVQDLAAGLNSLGCSVALFDFEQNVSTIRYESLSAEISPAQGSIVSLSHVNEVIQQLDNGEAFQFCVIKPMPHRALEMRFTILACPIMEESNLLGDIWLFRPCELAFSLPEIRLVEQVATQCAIALRQSQLYQKTQAHVEELEGLNRLKDDFLSSVSHELRSPMSNIKMATEMLEMVLHAKTSSGNKLQVASDSHILNVDRYLQILKEECRRETDLINDLLDLARLEADTDELIIHTVSLELWLPALIEPYETRILNQQQSLEIHIQPELPPLSTDTVYLGRAIAELIHNACKYTPAGETIRVEAKREAWSVEGEAWSVECAGSNPLPSTPNPPLSTPNPQPSMFQITVSNSGVEISPEEHDRVFDKFYRIPSHDPWQHGGTGLGLALVKRQIEQLQGTIHVSSDTGWTRFIVRLPSLIATAATYN